MEIAYLGPEDSYSHTAAIVYGKKNPQSKLVPYDSFYEIIQGIENRTIEEAVLPIENSTEGAVTKVMDLLSETKYSNIQGELTLLVEHSLLGLGSIEQLQFVYSHPQAIEQCKLFFINHYPHIELLPCQSTSQACRLVNEKGKLYGAIAHQSAEQRYGLKIIQKNIQDNPHNQTRFIIVGNKQMQPTGQDKTSIHFSFRDDYPGSLYLVLKLFADHHINLTRIESRPAKRELGNYTFYIDFAGHAKDSTVQAVLKGIGEMTFYLKNLGSYPMG